MTLEQITIAIIVAALGAAGVVEAVRAAVNGLWPARTASLRWVWRSLSVVAGGVLGWLAGDSGWASLAVGLGAGTMTTAVVGAVRARVDARTPAQDQEAERIER